MKGHKEMGQFSVRLTVANFRDVVKLAPGIPVMENVEHLVVSGVVDSEAARLVLPKQVADQLQLTVDGEVTVRYADHRQEKRPRVTGVWIQLNGRQGVFSAIVEPVRTDAVIGFIVLNDLDLLTDHATQTLNPRDPDMILTEIE